MLSNQKFDVIISRSLSSEGLRWPARGEADGERNLGCNLEYRDLRGLDELDASRILELEAELIQRMDTAADPEQEYEKIEDELCDDLDGGLFGLDIGVASAVIALGEMGCITFSSCNGGAFGGNHHESYPLVAFFAKPRHVKALLKSAEKAGIGLERSEEGAVIAFADDIRGMQSFAEALTDGDSSK